MSKHNDENMMVVRATLAEMVTMDFSNNPIAKFQSAIYNEMCKNGMGKFAKYIGRISCGISNGFWKDKKIAEEIIANFAITLKKTYEHYISEFGEDADQIFIDNMFQIKFNV